MIIVSVPHTGTTFLANLLRCSAQHATPEGVKVTGAIVSPLRHPLRVAQSWRKRGKSLDEMHGYWERLIALKPHYVVPIDVPEREDYLNLLRVAMGERLETDWVPVNHLDGEARLTDEETGRILTLMQHPFFEMYRASI